jgi:hypothetical protein
MAKDWLNVRVDREALSVGDLSEVSNELEYWLSKTPGERMEALELLRQVIYGYDPAVARLQRVLEVVELKRS